MACDAQAAITGGCCFCLGAKQVECIRVYLLALWAGLSTDPNTMAGLASNLGGLNVKDRAQIDTYLLSVIAGASSDPNTLAAAAKGFVIDGRQYQYYQIQDSLLCSLAGASCVPNTLATLARGFDGYGYDQLGQVATYCLAVKAGVSTSANALLALAKGFQGTPLKILFQEQTWLLCGLAADDPVDPCVDCVAPTGFNAVPSRGNQPSGYTVTLNFDPYGVSGFVDNGASAFIDSITVYRADAIDGPYETAGAGLFINSFPFEENGAVAGPVLPNTTYFYKVLLAFNNGCPNVSTAPLRVDVGCYAEEPSAVGPGPGELPGEIDVQWTLNVDPLADFVVKYGTTNGGPYPSQQVVAAGDRAVTLSGLTSGQTYYLIVQSRDSNSCLSSASAQTSAQPA